MRGRFAFRREGRRAVVAGRGGFAKYAVMTAKGLRRFAESNVGSGVLRLNTGPNDSMAGGASCLVYKRGTNDGLTGTRDLNVPVLARTRFLRVVTWPSLR